MEKEGGEGRRRGRDGGIKGDRAEGERRRGGPTIAAAAAERSPRDPPPPLLSLSVSPSLPREGDARARADALAPGLVLPRKAPGAPASSRTSLVYVLSYNNPLALFCNDA